MGSRDQKPIIIPCDTAIKSHDFSCDVTLYISFTRLSLLVKYAGMNGDEESTSLRENYAYIMHAMYVICVYVIHYVYVYVIRAYFIHYAYHVYDVCL